MTFVLMLDHKCTYKEQETLAASECSKTSQEAHHKYKSSNHNEDDSCMIYQWVRLVDIDNMKVVNNSGIYLHP